MTSPAKVSSPSPSPKSPSPSLSPLQEILSSAHSDWLHERCIERKIPHSGKKSDVIERLTKEGFTLNQITRREPLQSLLEYNNITFLQKDTIDELIQKVESIPSLKDKKTHKITTPSKGDEKEKEKTIKVKSPKIGMPTEKNSPKSPPSKLSFPPETPSVTAMSSAHLKFLLINSSLVWLRELCDEQEIPHWGSKDDMANRLLSSGFVIEDLVKTSLFSLLEFFSDELPAPPKQNSTKKQLIEILNNIKNEGTKKNSESHKEKDKHKDKKEDKDKEMEKEVKNKNNTSTSIKDKDKDKDKQKGNENESPGTPQSVTTPKKNKISESKTDEKTPSADHNKEPPPSSSSRKSYRLCKQTAIQRRHARALLCLTSWDGIQSLCTSHNVPLEGHSNLLGIACVLIQHGVTIFKAVKQLNIGKEIIAKQLQLDGTEEKEISEFTLEEMTELYSSAYLKDSYSSDSSVSVIQCSKFVEWADDAPMSRAEYRKQCKSLGISVQRDQDVLHLIAEANGGANHPKNYFHVGANFLNRSVGNKFDFIYAGLAGLDATKEAVKISQSLGNSKGKKYDGESAEILFSRGQKILSDMARRLRHESRMEQ